MTQADYIRQAQVLLGVTVDGIFGKDTLDALRTALGDTLAPRPSSAIPDDYWPMLSKIESSDKLYALPPIDPNTGRPYSSASGLYQFIRSTWEGEGGKWGTDPFKAFGGLRPTADEQLARVKTFTEKNARALQAAGIGLNKASLYAAHFLGVGTAIKAINGDVKKPVAIYVSTAAVKANKTILGGGKTVGDFLTWLFNKTGAWAR
jgi:hypothetical protein